MAFLSKFTRPTAVQTDTSSGDTENPPKNTASAKRCTARRCCLSCCLCCFVATMVILITIVIGAAVERKAVEAAAGTDWIYGTPVVCSHQLISMDNASSAEDEGVMHCGECGKCSNRQDIQIYDDTKVTRLRSPPLADSKWCLQDTLTNTATRCALWSFWSVAAVSSCLDTEVGFTEGCNQCWVDNVMCDQASCKWTCMQV